MAGNTTITSGSIQGLRNATLNSGGVISLGSGLISLSGNWTNQGTFSAGTGTVNSVDGCGTTTSAFSGDTAFFNFSATTTSGRLLQFDAGSTQAFNGNLALSGAVANPLTIRSSIAGTSAFFILDPAATQHIFAVDVADNNASAGQTIAPYRPHVVSSIDSGGNLNWFAPGPPVTPPAPIPTLPRSALFLLALLLWVAARRFRPEVSTERLSP